MIRKAVTQAQRIAERTKGTPNQRGRMMARDAELGKARKIRSRARWQAVRAAKLRKDPVCEPCRDKGRITGTGLQVHHIRPLKTHPFLAYVMSNLQTICTACHAKESQKERMG